MKKILPYFLFFWVVLLPGNVSAAGENLITNPSVENPSSDPNLPDGWYQDYFGNGRRQFTYPVTGQDGQNGVKIEILRIGTRGDAKWAFNDVPATGGVTYTYTDYYQSNITSYLIVRYTNKNGRFVYVDLATLPAANQWTQTNNTFKAPANATSITVYHLIKDVGWLSTDNYALSASGPSNSPVPTPTSTTGQVSPTPTSVVPTPTTSPIITIPDTPTPTDVIPPTVTDTPTPEVPSPTPTTEPITPTVPVPTPTTVVATPTQTPNNGGLIVNGSLENSASGSMPDNWAKGGWGTNTATLSYPVAGFDGAKAAKVDITQFTSGDAKWYFDDVLVTPNTSYNFSDSYQSNVTSTLVIRYTNTSGVMSYVNLATLSPSANWTTTNQTFTVPSGIQSLTIFHLINSIGSLTTDKYSLNQIPPPPSFTKGMVSLDFDDGWTSTYQNGIPILNAAGYKSTQYIITQYMENAPGYATIDQIMQMANQGHDIEAHSQTHADLTTLSQAQMEQEVCGSRQDLINIGITPVAFAYPYGNWNQNIVNTLRTCGFGGARTALIEDGGFNAVNQNPYLLKTLSIESSTSLADIQAAIDTAASTKTWLILVMHSVASDGSQYDTPPAKLQSIVDYLKTSNVDVVTVRQGVSRLAP